MPRHPDPEVEKRILTAASRLWARGGEKALTMRAVASAAETTTPTVYERYRDRADILRALRLQTRRQLFAALNPTRTLSEAVQQYLDFALESSDNNQFGMLTPAYFALDDFTYNNVAGIEENAALAVSMFPNPVRENVTIKGTAGTITVTNTAGITVYTGETNGSLNISCENWPNGYYIVTFANENGVHRSTLVKN